MKFPKLEDKCSIFFGNEVVQSGVSEPLLSEEMAGKVGSFKLPVL
jgi:hypothetical protein